MTVVSNSFTLHAKPRDGRDGAGTERVYIRTKTLLAPVIDDGSDPIGSDSNDRDANSEGYLPMVAAGTGGEVEETDVWLESTRGSVLGGGGEWGEATATPKGVSATWPYEWVKERRLGAPNARGVRAWPAYEGSMSLHEKWSRDGNDAETYEIVFTEAWAKVSVGNEISAALKGYAYKVTGGTRTAMAGATVRVGYILGDADTYEEITANGSGYFSEDSWFNGDMFSPQDQYNKGSKTIFAAIIVSGQVKCAEHVLLVKDAAQGQKGDTGKVCYIAGPYDPGQTYTSNAQQTVAVEYEYNGVTEIWMLAAATNVVNGVHYGPHDGGNYWSQGLNEENILRAKYLFADFASLGSFIVSKDFFLSQYGTLVGFGGDIPATATRTVGKVYMKKVDGKMVPHYAAGSSESGDKPCYLFFDADDPMAGGVQDGPTFTIEGKGVASAVIVRRVWLRAAAATTVSVTVTPSSEANCDFGAVGELDSPALSADGVTVATVKSGTTPTLVKASGTTAQTATASVAAGWHFFEIAYLKDAGTNGNLDKAVFTFAETGYNSHITGLSMMAFRPMKVVNALSGEEWQAQGNVHVSPEGNVTVKGTLEMKGLTVRLADITPWGTASMFVVGVNTTVGGSDIAGIWNFRCGNGQTVYLPTNRYYYLGQRLILYNSSTNLGGGSGTFVECGDIDGQGLTTAHTFRGIGTFSAQANPPTPQMLNSYTPVSSIMFFNGIIELMCVPTEAADSTCEWCVINIGTMFYTFDPT